MSSETTPEKKRKRRSTSIPFIIFVLLIGLVGYFKGEEILTYTLYLQEQWNHNSSVAEDQRRDKLAGPAKDGEYDWISPLDDDKKIVEITSPVEEGPSQTLSSDTPSSDTPSADTPSSDTPN